MFRQTLNENAFSKERLSSMDSKTILLTSELDRAQSKTEKFKSQAGEVCTVYVVFKVIEII